MKEYVIKAPAKVNLSLDVVGKREDGYHDMCMLNHSITLADKLTVRSVGTEIELRCSDPSLPQNSDNLVWRVAEGLRREFGVSQGAEIVIDKQIPSQAGLAGGSSDAAAAILTLNQCWQLNMSLETMYAFGARYGADIPYCCFKGTAIVEGIGEKIVPIKPIRRMPVLVVKPPIDIATPWAFACLDNVETTVHPNIQKTVECLETEDYMHLNDYVGNAFETVVFEAWPEIRELKKQMYSFGALTSVMSGSGSTIVGYFDNDKAIKKAAAFFEKRYELTFISEIE